MAEFTRAELTDRLSRERLRAATAEERAARLETELQEARAGWKNGRVLSPTQMRRIHKLALHQEGLDRDALWTALGELRNLRAERDRLAELAERTEQAVHGFFTDADQRGVHLDGMTVTELCDAVMAEIRALDGTEAGQ